MRTFDAGRHKRSFLRHNNSYREEGINFKPRQRSGSRGSKGKAKGAKKTNHGQAANGPSAVKAARQAKLAEIFKGKEQQRWVAVGTCG